MCAFVFTFAKRFSHEAAQLVRWLNCEDFTILWATILHNVKVPNFRTPYWLKSHKNSIIKNQLRIGDLNKASRHVGRILKIVNPLINSKGAIGWSNQTFGLCAKQGLRLAWESPQSDQFCYASTEPKVVGFNQEAAQIFSGLESSKENFRIAWLCCLS